jgi:hypothetical protein
MLYSKAEGYMWGFLNTPGPAGVEDPYWLLTDKNVLYICYTSVTNYSMNFDTGVNALSNCRCIQPHFSLSPIALRLTS